MMALKRVLLLMIAYLIQLAWKFLIKAQNFLVRKEFFPFYLNLSTTFTYSLQPEESELLPDFLLPKGSHSPVILLRGHQLLPHSMTL